MARLSSQCGVGALAWGMLLFSSPHALAQPAAKAIDLHYEASPGCPDRSELLRRIHDRAPSGWPSADDRSFRVHIERRATDYHGRLEIERKGRVLSAREIHGATCDVVGTAISVFVAIALDPAEVPAPDAPPPEKPAPGAPPKTVSPDVHEPVSRPPKVDARWYLGTGFAASSLLNPSVAWGGRVYASILRRAPGALVSPELRLSWGWADFTESPPRGGEAQLRFRTARAEACALVDRATLTLAACGGFEAGLLDATTRDLPRAGGTSEPWYAPTLAVRPGWFLADWVSVEAELGALFPLTRASFVVAEPERTVYRIPMVAVTASAGFRIWARLP